MRKTIDQTTSLLDALSSLFPESSRTTLRQMLEAQRVRVNGAIERQARRSLQAGDVLSVGNRDEGRHLHPKLSLLFEDDDLIVVVKDHGLLTVSTIDEREETAQAFLNAYLYPRGIRERIHVVHRLDRESSGVLVFAKNFKTRELLKELFAAHDIDRVYVALIEGAMPQERGTIRSFLREDDQLRVSSVRNERGGKLAITHYRVVEAGSRYSRLEVRLETGRRNQIRVHMAEAGHSIVGDKRYGAKSDPIARLGLHARLLGFVHPHSGKKMAFEAPVPEEFMRLKL